MAKRTLTKEQKIVRCILSWLVGFIAADRFYEGKILTGILKLITVSGFGIWYLVDAIRYTAALAN